MMFVDTIIRPSKIHGLGLFAVRAIAKGTLVWRYVEPVDRRIHGLCSATDAWREFLAKYAYRPPGADYIELCGDASLFMNHSDAPNCGAWPKSDYMSETPDCTYALRDIAADEELTEDYRTFNILPMPWLEGK